MAYGVKLKIWGEYACFTRPEMKVERVSYDVITPSAARGILEAIHWKPAIRWVIDRIHVLQPIKFQNIRRNEVQDTLSYRNAKIAMKKMDLNGLAYVTDDGKNRQQRAMLALTNVAYVIEAHFELTDKAGPDDKIGKHLDIFNRRARAGKCFQRPCLGVREFPADFELLEDQDLPHSALPEDWLNRDLGWMFYDLDYGKDKAAQFYPARLENGIIEVAKLAKGAKS